MNTHGRYLLLSLTILIMIYHLLSYTHEFSRNTTYLSYLVPKLTFRPQKPDNLSEELDPLDTETGVANYKRANATFVVLCRNSELEQAVQSIRENEDRFNRHYGYPYVFLNEVPFTNEFKEAITVVTPAPVEFGVIPREHWYQPDWIDEERAASGRQKLQNVIYGSSVSYRNMCRFNSGFFFRHPLMEKYRWYWRIEPDVHFYCDLQYDPFLFMEQNNKTYSFTITMSEFESTIASLWGHVKNFTRQYPEFVAQDNALGFLSDDNGDNYNLCHFWSNFEIADMEFWRSPAYTAFFDYLDRQGGFYYERWGDAPIHSIAAGLFLSKDQIHFFHDIGYKHSYFTNCPLDVSTWTKGRCSCRQRNSINFLQRSTCLNKWDDTLRGIKI